MIEFVKYTFNPNASDGSNVDLLPIMPEDFNYSISDVQVDGNIQRTLTCEDSEISKLTSMRFGDSAETQNASNRALSLLSVDLLNVSTLTNCTGMFYKCSNVTNINTEYFTTSNITQMNLMFRSCSKLTQLDVSKWDTSSVTNMNAMFYACSSLTQLDVSNWVTSKVTHMGGMFYYCAQLTKIDIIKWDISKVTDMSNMFNNCSQLTQLDVSKWNISKVGYMKDMFNNCSQLTQLDLSNWDISDVTNIDGIFSNCSKLLKIFLCNSSTSTVNKIIEQLPSRVDKPLGKIYTKNISQLNTNDKSWEYLDKYDLTKYTFTKVVNEETIDFLPVFSNNIVYEKVDVDNGDTITRTLNIEFENLGEFKKLTSMRFGDATSDDIEGVDASNRALSLLSVDLLNVSTLTTCTQMFRRCYNVSKIDTAYVSVTNVTSINSMFNNCVQLTQLDVSNWDTSNVTVMNYKFQSCSSLTQLDVSNWDTSKVIAMSNMF